MTVKMDNNSNRNQYLNGIYTAGFSLYACKTSDFAMDIISAIAKASDLSCRTRVACCIWIPVSLGLAFPAVAREVFQNYYGCWPINPAATATGTFAGVAVASVVNCCGGVKKHTSTPASAAGALVAGVVAESVKNYLEK